MSKLDLMIDKLNTKLKIYFNAENTGHSTDHLNRVLKYALFLQKHESGDEIVIGVSAFVHDVHRIMTAESGKYISPKDSIPKLKNL